MGSLSSQRGCYPAICRLTSLGRSWAPTYGKLVQPAWPLARSLSTDFPRPILGTYLRDACPANGVPWPQSVGWLPYADLGHLPMGGLYSQQAPTVSWELSVSGPSVPTCTVDGMSSQRGRLPAVCRPLSLGKLLIPTYRRLVQPAGPLARSLSAGISGRTLGENLGAAAVHLDGEEREACPHNT